MTRPTHGGNLAWAAAVAGCSTHEILDFSASISPLGPPQSVLETIIGQLPQQLSHYPEPGYRKLCQVLAQHHAIDSAWVIPGNGAAELLTWAGRELAQLEKCYCFSPSFADYRRAITSYGRPLLPLPLLEPALWQQGEFVWLSADSLWKTVLRHVAAKGAAAVPQRLGIIINTPHNPSGQLVSKELIRLCLEQFELVVVDEAFMDFLKDGERHSVVSWVENYPNLVVLRSLTKFYGLPGLRIGYAVGHPQRLRRWQQWRDPWSVNCLATVAASAALEDRAFQQKTWRWLGPTRQHLFDGLAALPAITPWPGRANFLLVHCHSSVEELQRQLLKQYRIYIRDCHSFVELGDRYFRIAVRTAENNQALLHALAQLLGTRN